MNISMKKRHMGERIKALREHYGLTQAQFAEKADTTLLTIGNIEREVTQKLQLETIHKICKVFGTSLQWLKDGSGEMLPAGEPEIVEEKEEMNPYRDYALKRLEKEADEWKRESAEWKKEYNKVWERFTNLLERVPLGKFNPVNNTAYSRTGS